MLRAAYLVFLTLSLAGCATRAQLALPSGTGLPLPDYADRFAAASASCQTVRTYEALIRLRGRGGGVDLGGRIRAGLAAPGAMRLEMLNPMGFGAPSFYFVARPDDAVLWLTREAQVLQRVPPAEIFASLTGVRLAPDDLRAVLTGCLVSDASPLGGRDHGEWQAIELEGGAAAYLRPSENGPRLEAGIRDGLTFEFSDFRRGLPRRVRVVSDARHEDSGEALTDLTATLTQVNVNVPFTDAVFRLDELPSDLTAITLKQLRGVAPLEVPPTSDTR